MATNWAQVAYTAAVKAGHPSPEIFVRQMRAESNLIPGQTSTAGAQGIAQIMPATAKAWGVNPNDPVASLNAAAKAMTKYLTSYNGNHAMALAAYNAGPGAVQKYNGVPPYGETKAYIAKILKGGVPAPRTPGGVQTGSYSPIQPLYGQAKPAPDATALSNQINRIGYAYTDAPELAQPHVDKLNDKFGQQMQAHRQSLQPVGFTGGSYTPGQSGGVDVPLSTGGVFKTPNGLIRPRFENEDVWQFLVRLGSKGFGLRNDAGNGQTTGGNHTAGSLHYAGQAVDWGDAKNGKPLLDNFYSWANKHRQQLGIQELIWQAPGHYNHLHIGLNANGGRNTPTPPPITPANGVRRPRRRSRHAH